MKPKQLILISNSIKENHYSKEDYFISTSNRQTYDELTAAKNRCVILKGPEKSGKTHLAMIWAEKNSAAVLDHSCIRPQELITRNCLIEDIEKLTTRKDLEDLLHCYNNAVENNKLLLMTATDLEFSKKLPDLNSRLLSTQTIKMRPPDDELLKVIIYKEFYLRHIDINESIADFIMKKVERSVKSVLAFIDHADNESLRLSQKISLRFLNCIAKSL